VTEKQWTATLKDGSTAIIRYMSKKDRKLVAELYKKFVIESWQLNPEMDTEEFSDRQTRRKNKTLVAILAGNLVSFMEILREAGGQELAVSYTIKSKRGLWINDCLRCLTIREFDNNKIIKAVFTPKSKETLMPKYEDLIKKVKMKEKGRGQGDAIYFEKTGESDQLLEGLLKDKFKLEY